MTLLGSGMYKTKQDKLGRLKDMLGNRIEVKNSSLTLCHSLASLK